jgi:hypothetical protein
MRGAVLYGPRDVRVERARRAGSATPGSLS